MHHHLAMEKGNYKVWDKTRDDLPVSQEEVNNLIENGVIRPCNLHPQEPSIEKCEKCEIDICVKCLRIRGRTRYAPSKYYI